MKDEMRATSVQLGVLRTHANDPGHQHLDHGFRMGSPSWLRHVWSADRRVGVSTGLLPIIKGQRRPVHEHKEAPFRSFPSILWAVRNYILPA